MRVQKPEGEKGTSPLLHCQYSNPHVSASYCTLTLHMQLGFPGEMLAGLTPTPLAIIIGTHGLLGKNEHIINSAPGRDFSIPVSFP